MLSLRDKCVLTHPVPVATKSERKLALMALRPLGYPESRLRR
jgi:hypothetical protein